MQENSINILLEQYFPYENMTIQERNKIFTFLYYTKDFESPIEIVTCNFNKQGNVYTINGLSAYANLENRCFIGSIEFKPDGKIIVENQITRLCINENKDKVPKTYKMIDIFIPNKDNLYVRKTNYSFLNKNFNDILNIDNYNAIYEDTRIKKAHNHI